MRQLNPERRGIGLLPLPAGPRAMGITVDARRSLAVTDEAIVSTFKFTDVMNQLAAQSGVPGLTGLQLYRQWWDTQNPKPGLNQGAHCNDELAGPGGTPSKNGYVYTCGRAEGAQVNEDPFANAAGIQGYVTIGLFNRFDLAAQDGSDCGEYRILFARREGISNANRRNLIIFEAVLPNPQPALGLEGCRPVAKYWADLTVENNAATRAQQLRDFYFNGLPGFQPVVHIDNYGNRTSGALTGQVRTNQFMQTSWTLREFKLQGDGTALRFVPVTDKTNPGGLLFSPTASHARKAEFQDINAPAGFPAQVGALAVNNINTFGMLVDDKFNTAQSNSQFNENNYSFHFTTSVSVLRNNIQSKLTAAGSNLTPDHIVRRAMAQSCAGCHELNNNAPANDLGNNMIWPRSLGFVHVSELTAHKDSGVDGLRFGISPALTNVFLPHRKAVIENFLNTPAPTCGPSQNSWQGCGETGCAVCASAIANFPCYFDNHPQCEPANMCYGQLTTCNSACPPPTSADACASSGYCGDGMCGLGEDSISCSWDCGGGGGFCDGICDFNDSCPSDCGGGGGFCGDGLCNLNTEQFNCPADCGGGGGGGICGDGICSLNEMCSMDCGNCIDAQRSGDLEAMKVMCPAEPVIQ